jgi:hypothetical protein
LLQKAARLISGVGQKGGIVKLPAISILFVLALGSVSKAHSDWYLTQPQGMSPREKIGDNKINFMLGNISCGVTNVKQANDPDGNKLEIRELYCDTDAVTRVSVMASCRKNVRFPTAALQIRRNHYSYLPSISCY